ncbi:MAG: hypothetical protein ABIH46_01310 [Chloroflexota bacterium]
MPAPTDRNSRIALAKGWTWTETEGDAWVWSDKHQMFLDPSSRQDRKQSHWFNSYGLRETIPNWTGTLEGMAELMRELNEHAKAHNQYWAWRPNVDGLVSWPRDGYYCAKHVLGGDYFKLFWSDEEHPGDCVSDAYLSVFEEKGAI